MNAPAAHDLREKSPLRFAWGILMLAMASALFLAGWRAGVLASANIAREYRGLRSVAGVGLPLRLGLFFDVALMFALILGFVVAARRNPYGVRIPNWSALLAVGILLIGFIFPVFATKSFIMRLEEKSARERQGR